MLFASNAVAENIFVTSAVMDFGQIYLLTTFT